jgi:hypothetical protein
MYVPGSRAVVSYVTNIRLIFNFVFDTIYGSHENWYITNENDFTVHSLQLINGSAGNRSNYCSWGTGKDQRVLFSEINDRGQ